MAQKPKSYIIGCGVTVRLLEVVAKIFQKLGNVIYSIIIVFCIISVNFYQF